MPKVIRRVCRLVRVPVIAGGLISDKEDVMAALSAGAISVSTTNPKYGSCDTKDIKAELNWIPRGMEDSFSINGT